MAQSGGENGKTTKGKMKQNKKDKRSKEIDQF